MNKSIRYLLLIILFQAISFTSKAQFPYVESFRAGTAPGITFGGAPSAFLTAAGSSYEGGTPIDPEGNGYLRLTNAAKNQKGYVYSNSNFPSFNGLRAEFEYYIYGGNGADGISFFLFDATANPFTIGGFGGSLGYAQITTTDPISPGVSKGYLAVGLDEFGNFSNPNEGRQGGPGYKPGSVTLRGKGDGAALTPENYKWLTTEETANKGITLVGNGFGRTPDSTNTGYRRVLMEMEPRLGGGFYVSVKLKRGGSGILQPITIIDRFEYTEPAPPNLRYGFASSTGDQTHFHEVRNVSISVFNEAILAIPIANNDAQNACSGNQVNINVIANDLTKNTGATIAPGTIDLDPVTSGAQKSRFITGRGTFTANEDGTVTFSPSSSFSGDVSTTYVVKDSYGKTSSIGTITINYTAPSIAANAGPDQFINVLAILPTQTATLAGNNPGAGSTGVWSQVSGPNSAAFTSASANNTTVTNLIGGTYIFRWTVIAAGGCTTTDDVRVDVNRPPVAVDDNFTTTISTDIAIPIIDNDTDPDGNTTIDISTVVIKAQPQNGTATADPVTGKVIYRPNNGFLGNDSFTYTIKDIHGLESNIAVVTIRVSLEPIGLNDNANTTTNNQVIIPVIDNDPSRANATVIADTNPAHGNVFINADGTVTYVPTTGYSGRDSFTYKIKNTSGSESDPITVLVNVYPKGNDDLENTFTGVPVAISVKDNDVSKNGTTVVSNLNPTNGTISVNNTGAILYTPNAGFSGKDSFTYRLRTADGLDSDPITVNINVRPVGTADHGVYTVNTPLNIAVKDNDVSKNGTSVIINTTPANGTVLTDGSGVITYTPNAGFTGNNTFTYILRTADGLESAPITVTVTSVAGRPIGLPDEATTPAGIPVTIPVKANDPSATGTIVVVATQPTNGSVVLNAGVPIYTPANGFSGKDTFTYTLRDGSNVDSAPITVIVNVKPVGTPDIVNTTAGTPVTSPVKDNDPSKTGTSVIPVASPNGGTITVTPTGPVTYTPLEGFSGKDTYTYLLRTADGVDSDPITVNVTVKPVGSTDDVSTPINTPLAIAVKNNDLSKAATTVVINTVPQHGTATVSPEGVVTYNPTAGYNGTDVFTYILRTADGVDSDPITVNVNITNRPIGSNDEITTPFNTPTTINIKANDASASTTTVVLVTPSPNGTATLNANEQVFFSPAATFSGKTTFTYKLRAADNSESDPITVTVIVKPVGASDNATTPINTPITINIKDNDLSKVGTTPVVLATPLHGTVTVDAGGNAVYTPTVGYTGTDSFTYKLRTADGVESDPITVSINVTPPIPAPNLNVTIPADQPANITVPLPAGGTTVVVTGPRNGTVSINPTTGQPVYTPAPGYSGPDSFTYIIKDANGNESSVGIVSINVIKPARVGLAKSLISNVRSVDGTVKLNYLFTIINLGDIAIERLSLTDDLTATFAGRIFSVTRVAGSGTLRVNGAFNGSSVKEMLLNTSTLSPNFKEQVELEVTFAANQVGGSFSNTATTSGFSVSNGAVTSDISTNGLTPDPVTPGDVSPSAPTIAVILTAENIVLPVQSDQPTVVPITVPNGGNVVITNPPKNGTITFDPTGKPIYTPRPGYSGPDDFTYVVRDGNGNESPPATVTITVSSPAKIGLAKALIGNSKNADGSFNLRYQFTLVNYGDFAINNLSLTENLNLAFPGTNYQILDITTASTSGLRINSGYNGNSVPNMLLPTSSLAAKSKQTITLEIKVVLQQESGTFINFAIARGNSASDGSIVEDQSTNGFNPDPVTAGDVSPSVLTTVTLIKETLKIPGGFSPNNDGVNDFFVVQNAGDQAISLEVYNRWGNRIYKASKYDNTWNGKTTEGIHVGEDVPAGTYYYVIIIGGKDKRVGYITINR